MIKRINIKNKIRVDMSEINYLDILEKSLLSAGVPPRLISVGAYSEESFCIEKRGSKWIVYWGERGIEDDIREFGSPIDTGYYLITRISESIEEEVSIKRRFGKAFAKLRSKAITASTTTETKKTPALSFEYVTQQSKTKNKYTISEQNRKSLRRGFR